MQIDIQAQGLKLTNGFRRHIEKRLYSTLNFAKQDISKVVVHLSDENSRSDIKDKYCRIQIKPQRQPTIVTENCSSNIYVALESALDRTKRSVSKRMKKLQKLRHRAEAPLLTGST